MPSAPGVLRGAGTDDRTINLLAASFGSLVSQGPRLAAVFYGELFRRRPELRALFPTDMDAQGAKLLATLTAVIHGLRDTEAIRHRLQELGRRHAGYGARPEHYPLVADCLVHAMATLSGAGWTDELDIEWRGALDLMARIMLDGAAGAGAGSA